MLNPIFRALIRTNVSSVIRVLNPIPNKLFCVQIQINPFSSSAQKPISQIANKDSFTVNYLINTFGFSPEKALSASNYLKVGSKEKPESVVTFLKNQGFTKEQILHLVRIYPPIILCCPEKILLPKIEFFRSWGFSDSEVTKIFLAAPELFKRSLDKLLPSFNYIKSFFDANGISMKNSLAKILLCNLESRLIPNIEVLRDAGVPDLKIIVLLQYHPRALMVDTEKFREVVEEVKRMKFNPCSLRFVLAIHAFRAVKKSTWEEKVAVYRKWGWSEDDVIFAFERHPHCMMRSAEKITAVMDFLVNEMGFDSSLVVKMPDLISYKLEERVKPRFLVYKKLREKGLIKKGSLIQSSLRLPESGFLKRFVQHYEKEVPELLELYQKALAVSKS